MYSTRSIFFNVVALLVFATSSSAMGFAGDDSTEEMSEDGFEDPEFVQSLEVLSNEGEVILPPSLLSAELKNILSFIRSQNQGTLAGAVFYPAMGICASWFKGDPRFLAIALLSIGCCGTHHVACKEAYEILGRRLKLYDEEIGGEQGWTREQKEQILRQTHWIKALPNGALRFAKFQLQPSLLENFFQPSSEFDLLTKPKRPTAFACCCFLDRSDQVILFDDLSRSAQKALLQKKSVQFNEQNLNLVCKIFLINMIPIFIIELGRSLIGNNLLDGNFLDMNSYCWCAVGILATAFMLYQIQPKEDKPTLTDDFVNMLVNSLIKGDLKHLVFDQVLSDYQGLISELREERFFVWINSQANIAISFKKPRIRNYAEIDLSNSGRRCR